MHWFDVWIERKFGGDMLIEPTRSIWIQVARTSDLPAHGWLQGRTVARLVRGLYPGKKAYSFWLEYACCCCKAWNACLIACRLLSFVPTTPGLILADALDDLGGHHELSWGLRYWFDPSARERAEMMNLEVIPSMPQLDSCGVPLNLEIEL